MKTRLTIIFLLALNIICYGNQFNLNVLVHLDNFQPEDYARLISEPFPIDYSAIREGTTNIPDNIDVVLVSREDPDEDFWPRLEAVYIDKKQVAPGDTFNMTLFWRNMGS